MDLIVSAAPHVHGGKKSSLIMYFVLLSLLPAAIAGTLVFGPRAALLMAVTVLSSVAAEALWQAITKKSVTVKDGSAAVTGLLLAFCLPVTLPYWMAALGGIFAVIIAKALFGGLGHNFMNPALCGRAFLMASWPAAMTTWALPFSRAALVGADAATGATPLADSTAYVSLKDLFFGTTGGCIGETSALALLIGAVFLLATRIISLHVPLAYLGSAAFFGWMMAPTGLFTGNPLKSILTGGVMLGAFFMATDYVTGPLTRKGQVIFGLGCGALTMLIRRFGAYPEGVTYAILLMNAVSPLIDRYVRNTPYGKGGKRHA